MHTDIILTNPSGITGETVASRLRNYGLNVVFMDAPNAGKMEESYIARLHKFVEKYNPDSIWPIFFTHVLARHRDEFPSSLSIPLDKASKILKLDNKLECNALAESLGILLPRHFNSVDEAISSKIPLVFKRPMGLGGDSVYFPRTEKALRNLVKGASNSDGYLITEFIEGDDICVDAIRWKGYFYGAAYRILEPRRKGVSIRRISIDAPIAVATLRRILDAIDYRGVCGADFRVSSDGTVYFLECNPRFCGGLESAVASGFDIPLAYWQLSHGITPEPVRFTPGIVTGPDIENQLA